MFVFTWALVVDWVPRTVWRKKILLWRVNLYFGRYCQKHGEDLSKRTNLGGNHVWPRPTAHGNRGTGRRAGKQGNRTAKLSGRWLVWEPLGYLPDGVGQRQGQCVMPRSRRDRFFSFFGCGLSSLWCLVRGMCAAWIVGTSDSSCTEYCTGYHV